MTAVRWGQSSSGKSHLASCGDDGSVRVWDAEAGACVHVFDEHASVSSSSACFNLPAVQWTLQVHISQADSKQVRPSACTHCCCCQPPSTASHWLALGLFIPQAVTLIAWSPDATYLASGDASGRLLVWSLRSGGVVRSMQVGQQGLLGWDEW